MAATEQLRRSRSTRRATLAIHCSTSTQPLDMSLVIQLLVASALEVVPGDLETGTEGRALAAGSASDPPLVKGGSYPRGRWAITRS